MPDYVTSAEPDDFTMVQNIFLQHGAKTFGLSSSDMLMYIQLRSFAFHGKHTAFPGQEKLAELCSITKRTAIKCLNHLHEVGLIRKEKRFLKGGFQTSNLYTFLSVQEVFNERQALAQSSEVPEVPGAKLINIGGVNYIDDREVNDSKPEGAPTGPENEEQARADRFTWQPGDAEIIPPQQDNNNEVKPSSGVIHRGCNNFTPGVKYFHTNKKDLRIKEKSITNKEITDRAKEKSAAFLVTPVVDHELNKKQIKKLRDLVSAKDGGKGRKTEIQPGPVNTRIHPDPVEEGFPLENSKQGGDYP